MNIHITQHAIDRYRERVADVSEDQARETMSCAFVQNAADFGAPYVRLGTGQRLVIANHSVVTVLPKEHWEGAMGMASDQRRNAT